MPPPALPIAVPTMLTGVAADATLADVAIVSSGLRSSMETFT
jgi:hypothetical protein